jgi:L-lactate dehydrogenase complex protein LldE
MQIGLFIPCYIDQLYPRVGLATLDVLEEYAGRWARENHQELQIEFPPAQTCCGQPMANTGCADTAKPLGGEVPLGLRRLRRTWSDLREAAWRWFGIIMTSTALVVPDSTNSRPRRTSSASFCTDVLKLERIEGRFPASASAYIKAATGFASCGWAAVRSLPSPRINKDAHPARRTGAESRSPSCRAPTNAAASAGRSPSPKKPSRAMMGLDRIHDQLARPGVMVRAGQTRQGRTIRAGMGTAPRNGFADQAAYPARLPTTWNNSRNRPRGGERTCTGPRRQEHNRIVLQILQDTAPRRSSRASPCSPKSAT